MAQTHSSRDAAALASSFSGNVGWVDPTNPGVNVSLPPHTSFSKSHALCAPTLQNTDDLLVRDIDFVLARSLGVRGGVVFEDVRFYRQAQQHFELRLFHLNPSPGQEREEEGG